MLRRDFVKMRQLFKTITVTAEEEATKNLHQTYRKKGQFCGYQMGGERAN